MGYFVKCPQCNEINSGSSLYCEKCQTNLIGIPREKDPTTIDEIVNKQPDNQETHPTGKMLNAHIFFGLMVGIVSFFALIILTFGKEAPCCGIIFSIGAGAIAGKLTSHFAIIGTREDASRLGAISGAIAGIFAFFGQVYAGILPYFIFELMKLAGLSPSINVDLSTVYISAFFVPSLINGIFGFFAAAIAGSFTAIRVSVKLGDQKDAHLLHPPPPARQCPSGSDLPPAHRSPRRLYLDGA